MKKFYLLVLLCLFSFSSTVVACSCVTQEPANAFNEAKVVFIGRMLGGTQKLSLKDQAGKTFTIEAGKVRFTVEEIFKGSNAEEFTVNVDSHEGTSCGPYGLTRGERYLVYAYGTETGEILFTGVCTRTQLVDGQYAKKDLAFLRNLPPAGTGGSMHGWIWADLKAARTTPLSDVRVKISSADEQVITVFTDQKGEFKVKQLKPGKYKVEPEYPSSYTSEQKFVEVDVADRGTATVGFEAYIDGRVTGRVLDKDGNSFNHIFLKMEGEGRTVFGHSTGEDGGFEVKNAPPGEYVLYVELEKSDYTQKPYYYPGTFQREKAAAIRLGLGELIENLEFRLPPEYVVRTVEGEVAWKDGTPAADVEVMLLCAQSSTPNGFVIKFGPTRTRTDNQGNFRLEGFVGQTYWIEARGSKEGKNPNERLEMHSPSRKLSLVESAKDVRLRLSENGPFGAGCSR
jgi:hypothetical protein